MRSSLVRVMAVVLAVVALAASPPALAQGKKLVFWTHWEQNPDFNKWYETRGKDFAQKSGYEVQVVTVPYQGYEAKYLAALIARSGAPDIFMGMTHHWCGQYDFCDKMPADLAKTWDENLPKCGRPEACGRQTSSAGPSSCRARCVGPRSASSATAASGASSRASRRRRSR